MNTIPTIEELDKIGCAASGFHPSVFGESSQMHTHLTAVRDAVVAACRPQLRPIEEMPEEVPEGRVRVYAGPAVNRRWSITMTKYPLDTHFIDIALPVEDYPADFEQAFAEFTLDAKDKAAAFALWKGSGL